MEIVINIEEEESKEKTPDYQRLTTEQLKRLGEETQDAFLHQLA